MILNWSILAERCCSCHVLDVGMRTFTPGIFDRLILKKWAICIVERLEKWRLPDVWFPPPACNPSCSNHYHLSSTHPHTVTLNLLFPFSLMFSHLAKLPEIGSCVDCFDVRRSWCFRSARISFRVGSWLKRSTWFLSLAVAFGVIGSLTLIWLEFGLSLFFL